jgi:hypothetical protein
MSLRPYASYRSRRGGFLPACRGTRMGHRRSWC